MMINEEKEVIQQSKRDVIQALVDQELKVIFELFNRIGKYEYQLLQLVWFKEHNKVDNV